MRLVSALIAAASCVAAIGCGLNQEGIGPPNNTIFFPGAIRVDPTNGRWLYVVNSNSDLRYNDGTLVAVDLNAVDDDRELTTPWGNCPSANYIYPSSSPARPAGSPTRRTAAGTRSIATCSTATSATTSSRRCRSAASAARSRSSRCSPGWRPIVSRLFVGVRGNASITWADRRPAGRPDASRRLPPVFTAPTASAASSSATPITA